MGTFNNTYYVIYPGERVSLPELTLLPSDSSHPILDGVKSFSGGNYSFRGGNLIGDAHVVALWSDYITPLIGTRLIKNSRRVDLNFFPPSSDASPGLWRSNTNGAKIIANALTWVADGACAANSDCISCATTNVCQWCVDTQKCSSEDFSCPNRVAKPGNCPPSCLSFSKCTSCLSAKFCSWCLDNDTCVVKNATCRGEFNDPIYCSS